MKKNIIGLLIITLFAFTNKSTAQNIAVSNISTSGVYATPEIGAKLTRLELAKINKYVVMDEADMKEKLDEKSLMNCYGKKCVTALGVQLGVPTMLSGSIDGLGNKIVVSLKVIDVKNETIQLSKSMEFYNQEVELQRMIGIVLKEMFGIPQNEEVKKQLAYSNDVIVNTNLSRLNNSGPRIGFAFVHESELYDFFKRSETQGGLGIYPATTNLGYQFEAQYIGTENFSALAEFIFNVGGMEQGQFQPSFSILNGFRVGAKGWEFAFGPSFGLRRTSNGFFTEEGKNLFGREAGRYWTQGEAQRAGVTPEILSAEKYEYNEFLDKRGDLKINTNWLMGIGRTFKAGALNVPVNIYYSYNKYGGSIGASMGFNVSK